MPTQVVNSELVDLLRPFFWAKSDTISCCPWKLCAPDGAPDPAFEVDNAGNATAHFDLTVDGWLYAMPGISTEWIDGNGGVMSVHDCYNVELDCVSSGEHNHGGVFSVTSRLFIETETVVNNLGWTDLFHFGVGFESGMLLVNSCSGSNSANAQYQAVVYYSNAGAAGVATTIEEKVGAANAELQMVGDMLQCKADNADLIRVAVIRLESMSS